MVTAAAGAPILEVSAVDKRFGGMHALRDLSFGLEAGKVTALIGPNGAGKTTAFNVMSGFLRPDRGAVCYRGQPIHALPPHRIVRLGIGRSFQDVRVFGRLTALQNVMVACQDQPNESPLRALVGGGGGTHEQRNRARGLECLAFVGLAAQADELADSLSYGQQKRLTIARLLAAGCEVLLLDEPASGLDPGAVEGLLELIRRLAADGRTICLIEHNRDAVAAVSDRVVFLDQGHAVAEGDCATIMADPRLAERYLGV